MLNAADGTPITAKTAEDLTILEVTAELLSSFANYFAQGAENLGNSAGGWGFTLNEASWCSWCIKIPIVFFSSLFGPPSPSPRVPFGLSFFSEIDSYSFSFFLSVPLRWAYTVPYRR